MGLVCLSLAALVSRIGGGGRTGSCLQSPSWLLGEIRYAWALLGTPWSTGQGHLSSAGAQMACLLVSVT
jgi:hypothetical protein